MHILIGTVVVVITLYITIRYWRVSIPILVVLGIAIALFVRWVMNNHERNRIEESNTVQRITERFAQALNSPPSGTWRVVYDRDPASQSMVPTMAEVYSYGDVCRFGLWRQRTGDSWYIIECNGYEVKNDFAYCGTGDTTEMKFDTATNSQQVPTRCNIPGFLSFYGDAAFTQNVLNANVMAMKVYVRDKGTHGSALEVWVRFPLAGSAKAINEVLRVQDASAGGSLTINPIRAGAEVVR